LFVCATFTTAVIFRYFDWFKAFVDPETNQAWISFHSRNTDWIPSKLGSLQFKVAIKSKAGAILVQDTVTIDTSITEAMELSYVAIQGGGKQAVLHIHGGNTKGGRSTAYSNSNTSTTTTTTQGSTITKILFNGREVTIPSTGLAVPSNGHVVLTTDLTRDMFAGALWTCVLIESGGRGRQKIHFTHLQYTTLQSTKSIS
jgi:hypothetical protein